LGNICPVRLDNIIPEEVSPFLFNSNTIQYKAIYLVVDLMEKFIPVRNAKLKVMDKIMDKMWKTLKGFLRAAMNVCATPYPQFCPQPSASASKPQQTLPQAPQQLLFLLFAMLKDLKKKPE
jgi:hypothetical protein